MIMCDLPKPKLDLVVSAIRRWAQEMIERKADMTKDDLKTGMIIERRNKSLCLVLQTSGHGLMFLGEGFPWIFLSSEDSVKHDLTGESSEYDVMVVYQPRSKADYIPRIRYKKDWSTIWKREEPEEMTMEEVCKALGKTIKIVKEKSE